MDYDKDCVACLLISGKRHLPGGRIYETKHWVVEHCIGPLGVGTLIVKTIRHCIHFWELKEKESAELGPLLKLVSETINAILSPDQVYVCLWSHAGWKPVHLHFVLQPSFDKLQSKHPKPGPFLQCDMFSEKEFPPEEEIKKFCDQARQVIKDFSMKKEA